MAHKGGEVRPVHRSNEAIKRSSAFTETLLLYRRHLPPTGVMRACHGALSDTGCKHAENLTVC